MSWNIYGREKLKQNSNSNIKTRAKNQILLQREFHTDGSPSRTSSRWGLFGCHFGLAVVNYARGGNRFGDFSNRAFVKMTRRPRADVGGRRVDIPQGRARNGPNRTGTDFLFCHRRNRPPPSLVILTSTPGD